MPIATQTQASRFVVTKTPAAAQFLSKRGHRRRVDDRRTPHRVPCRVQLVDGAGNCVGALSGHTVNISSKGLSVQVPEPLAPGVRVEAYVPQPDGEALQLVGQVAHTRRVLAGSFEVGIATGEV